MLPMVIFSVCVARISLEIGVNVAHILIYRFGREFFSGVHPNDFYEAIPYVAHGHFLGLRCSDFFENWCQFSRHIDLSI